MLGCRSSSCGKDRQLAAQTGPNNRRRRMILAAVLVVVVVVIAAFLIIGVPLIQQPFTRPVTALPTANPGNSLRARYTQTAQAKANAASGEQTPQATSQ